jgi:electron transport complex protein RnfB
VRSAPREADNREVKSSALADRLHDALPQTQCTRCGFADCRAYADAIADGSAAINQCPPGGAQGIDRLARLTGQPALPLNPVHGCEGPRRLAVIDEDWCIGCTLCINACPVDCIVGASKQMHTVIDALCTGCELCIPVCPVDCISLVNVTGARTGWDAWSDRQADQARERYARHPARVQAPATGAGDGPAATRISETPASGPDDRAAERKRAFIDALLVKARSRKPSAGPDFGR